MTALLRLLIKLEDLSLEGPSSFVDFYVQIKC